MSEEHVKYMKEKAYVAVSAGGGRVLGAELVEKADKEAQVKGLSMRQIECCPFLILGSNLGRGNSTRDIRGR